MANNRIEIQVSPTTKLVAEINSDDNYKEIFIGIEKEGNYYQDLAVVGSQYHYNGNLDTVINDGYRVLVYGHSDEEDYTDEFLIDEYREEE